MNMEYMTEMYQKVTIGLDLEYNCFIFCIVTIGIAIILCMILL